MLVLEKAEQVKNDPQQFRKFCRILFNRGKNWLEVETLMCYVGYVDNGEIYRLYEEWQMEDNDR